MPDPIPPGLPTSITQGFLALAQQRRANLIELYDTGRWRHYYTEAEFMARMREVVGLTEAWSRIATTDRTDPPSVPPFAEAAE